MTVRELINKLLYCNMDATVSVLVEIDRKSIIQTMTEFSNYFYPIADDINVDDVDNMGPTVRIQLEEYKI